MPVTVAMVAPKVTVAMVAMEATVARGVRLGLQSARSVMALGGRLTLKEAMAGTKDGAVRQMEMMAAMVLRVQEALAIEPARLGDADSPNDLQLNLTLHV